MWRQKTADRWKTLLAVWRRRPHSCSRHFPGARHITWLIVSCHSYSHEISLDWQSDVIFSGCCITWCNCVLFLTYERHYEPRGWSLCCMTINCLQLGGYVWRMPYLSDVTLSCSVRDGSLPEIFNYLPDGARFSWVSLLILIQVKFPISPFRRGTKSTLCQADNTRSVPLLALCNWQRVVKYWKIMHY